MVTDLRSRGTVPAIVKSSLAKGAAALAATAALALALTLPSGTAGATPAFATATGQSCGFCHTRESIISSQFLLNAQGIAFKNNNFRLRQPVCVIQKMELYDRNRVPRGMYDVRVCN